MTIALIIGIGLVLVGIGYLIFAYKPDNVHPDDRAEHLGRKYDTNMTRYSARKETKASTARGELAASLDYEAGRLASLAVTQTKAKMESLRKRNAEALYTLEWREREAKHAVTIAAAQNEVSRLQTAEKHGISPKAYEQMVIEQAKTQAALEMQKAEMLIGVEKKKLESNVDVDFENSLAQLDAKMAAVAQSLPEHRLGLLNRQLSEIHNEYENVKKLEDGTFRQKELSRLERQIEKWQRLIDAEEE